MAHFDRLGGAMVRLHSAANTFSRNGDFGRFSSEVAFGANSPAGCGIACGRRPALLGN